MKTHAKFYLLMVSVLLAAVIVLCGTPAVAKSGRLVFGMGWEPAGLDPHVTGSFEGAIVARAVFDTLIRQTPDGAFHPGLATRWELSSNGMTYTFYLRKGVTFHDGTPFTAETVKYSFDRIVDPATKSESAVSQVGPYKETEIVDDFTAKVHLSKPFGPFLTGIARSVVAIVSPPAAKKWGEQFDDHLVGTGPFIFKEWVRKDHVKLVRNPNYNWSSGFYNHQGPAYLEEIVIKFISEASVRLGTLETGETNMINEVPPHGYARLSKDAAYLTYNPIQPGAPLSIAMNVTKAPLDDLKVRQALEYAVDKQAIVKTLFAGLYPLAYAPLTPNTLGYWAGAKDAYGYDQSKAVSLLKEAGWVDSDGDGIREKDGQPLKLWWPTFKWQRMNQMAEMVQAQLSEIGIDLTVDVVAFPSMYEAANKCTHNLIHSGFEGGDPDVLSTVYASTNVGKGWAWTCIQDDRIDTLLAQGRTATNTDERVALYTELQKIILEKAMIIPIRLFTNPTAARAEVKGIRFDPEGFLPDLYDVFVEK
jgi:peptide/nickel transport system substrate-binding protein